MTNEGPKDATPYVIEVAGAGDLSRLAAIEAAAAGLFAPYGLAEKFAESLRNPNEFRAAMADGRLWVARAADRTVAGFALGCFVDAKAHLEEIDVHPDHGRRGVGALLLDAVVKWARRVGSPTLTLVTFSHVPWNGPFYARYGFRTQPEVEWSAGLRSLLAHETEIGIPQINRIVMCRDVRGEPTGTGP